MTPYIRRKQVWNQLMPEPQKMYHHIFDIRGIVPRLFPLNGLSELCNRQIGENTPNCSQRPASSSSRYPSICPPIS